MNLSLRLPLLLLVLGLALPGCVHLHPNFSEDEGCGDSEFCSHGESDDHDDCNDERDQHDDHRDGLERHIRDLEETLHHLEKEIQQVHQDLDEAHRELGRRHDEDRDRHHEEDRDRHHDGRRHDDNDDRRHEEDRDRHHDDRRHDEDRDRHHDGRRDVENDDRRHEEHRDRHHHEGECCGDEGGCCKGEDECCGDEDGCCKDRDHRRDGDEKDGHWGHGLPEGDPVIRMFRSEGPMPGVFGRTGVRGFRVETPRDRGPENRRFEQRDRRGPGRWSTENRNRRNDRDRPRGRQMRSQRPDGDPGARDGFDRQDRGNQQDWNRENRNGENRNRRDRDRGPREEPRGEHRDQESVKEMRWSGNLEEMPDHIWEMLKNLNVEMPFDQAGNGESHVEIEVIRSDSSDQGTNRKKSGDKKLGKKKAEKKKPNKKQGEKKAQKKKPNKKQGKKKAEDKRAAGVESGAAFKVVVGGIDGIESDVIFGSTEGIDPGQQSIHFESLDEIPEDLLEIFESIEMIPLEEVLGDLDEIPADIEILLGGHDLSDGQSKDSSKKKADKKKADKKKAKNKTDKKKDAKKSDKKKGDVTLEGRIVV